MTVDLKPVWRRKLPFLTIPVELIQKLKDPWTQEPLDYETFCEWATWMDLCPNIWNSFCFCGERIVSVMWGEFDPLLSELYIKWHSSIDEIQTYEGLILKSAYIELRSLAREMVLDHIYFISHRKAFIRKPDSPVAAHPTYIMEVKRDGRIR